MIGTGRAADRDTVLGLGAHAFLDLEADQLEDAGEVDVVFDVIGGEILDRSAALVRAGGTLVTIARPPTVQPKDGRAVFFVVEPDRAPARGARPAAQGRTAQAASSGRCGRSPKRPPRSPPASAPPARRSSGSCETGTEGGEQTLDDLVGRMSISQQAWLARHPRITLHFTPTSGSW